MLPYLIARTMPAIKPIIAPLQRARAISFGTPSTQNVIISDGVINSCQYAAVYSAATDFKMRNIKIDGSGLAGGIKTAAVLQYVYGGYSEVSDITIKNCQNSKGIQGVQTVINAVIEQPDTVAFVSISGAKYIRGGKVNRLVQGIKSGSVIDGLEISTQADLGTHAIQMRDVSNCIITNCKISIPSRYAINEVGTSDYNLICNNFINGKIQISGANTIATSNMVIK